MTQEEFFRLVYENGPDEAPDDVPDEWFSLPGCREAIERWRQKTAGGMRLREFIHWTIHHPFDAPPEDTPPEWLRMPEYLGAKEQWKDDIHDSISKVGNIWFSTEYLRDLSSKMSIVAQVEFYGELRRGFAWRESEFRPDFERGFPECVPFLPPPLTHEERRAAWDEIVRVGEELQRNAPPRRPVVPCPVPNPVVRQEPPDTDADPDPDPDNQGIPF